MNKTSSLCSCGREAFKTDSNGNWVCIKCAERLGIKGVTPLPKSKIIGRNKKCHCGSGKKYKQCCMRGERCG